MNEILRRLMMIMMAPDGGADGGGTPSPEGNPAPAGDTTPAGPTGTPPSGTEGSEGAPAGDAKPNEGTKPELPKYASQLSPEKRESEDYQKYVYKHQKLDDIADNYVELSKKLERSLQVPGKDADEKDIKAFLGKLGVPEKAEEYDLEVKGIDPDALPKDMADRFRKDFHDAGLTKTQAQKMYHVLARNYLQGMAAIQNQQKQAAQTFDARLAATLDKTYEVKSERDDAMKESATLFKQHMQRTGLGKLYKDSGLIYNTDFVLKIAAEEKARGGKTLVHGTPNGKGEDSKGEFGTNYSDEFQKAYGK